MTTADTPSRRLPLHDLAILLVDDCPEQLRLYAHLLRQAGADVTLECNGRAAVDNVRKHPNRFHLVLTDLEMPAMSGIDAARELRARAFDIPILAMSARMTPVLEAEMWQAGCSAHLPKPFTSEQLVGKILELTVGAKPRVSVRTDENTSSFIAATSELPSAPAAVPCPSDPNLSALPARSPANVCAAATNAASAAAAAWINPIDLAIRRLTQPPICDLGSWLPQRRRET